jgi:hypothetical protein
MLTANERVERQSNCGATIGYLAQGDDLATSQAVNCIARICILIVDRSNHLK